jgi:hypothetical protein
LFDSLFTFPLSLTYQTIYRWDVQTTSNEVINGIIAASTQPYTSEEDVRFLSEGFDEMEELRELAGLQ